MYISNIRRVIFLFILLPVYQIHVRENRRGNQEWTIQRKQKGQSKMDNPEKTEGAIKNGQSRETGNIEYNKTRDEDKYKTFH